MYIADLDISRIKTNGDPSILYDLPFEGYTLLIGQNYYGKPLAVDGVVYEKGFYAHSGLTYDQNCDIIMDISTLGYSSLSVSVGIEDKESSITWEDDIYTMNVIQREAKSVQMDRLCFGNDWPSFLQPAYVILTHSDFTKKLARCETM